MAMLNNLEAAFLVEAVLLWTGKGTEIMPSRDDTLLARRYGIDLANKLLSVIKPLESDFYSSNAMDRAQDLSEMAKLAVQDFQRKHPEAPGEIAEAFAWCYTFDFR